MGSNFKGNAGFDTLVAWCREDLGLAATGEPMEPCPVAKGTLWIGHEGGFSALGKDIARDLENLVKKNFRWDSTLKPVGSKNPRNWLPADAFLEVLHLGGLR